MDVWGPCEEAGPPTVLPLGVARGVRPLPQPMTHPSLGVCGVAMPSAAWPASPECAPPTAGVAALGGTSTWPSCSRSQTLCTLPSTPGTLAGTSGSHSSSTTAGPLVIGRKPLPASFAEHMVCGQCVEAWGPLRPVHHTLAVGALAAVQSRRAPRRQGPRLRGARGLDGHCRGDAGHPVRALPL